MAAIDTHNINTAWAPLIFGLIGIGGVLIPNQIIITIICPDSLIATATCLTACLRAVGQVIGTSIFYTQFTAVLTSNTYNDVVPVAIRSGIPLDPSLFETIMGALVATPWKEFVSGTGIGGMVPPETLVMLHDVVIEAFKGAFGRVWEISIAFGVVAVVASCFIEDLSSLMDGHIAVRYF